MGAFIGRSPSRFYPFPARKARQPMKNTSLFASFWAMPKGSGVWGEAP